MKLKLEDFKIFSITEPSKVVGGRIAACKTASYDTSSSGGCDDGWDWDD